MTDRKTINTGSKYDRGRLKRPEVKQQYVNTSVTCAEESDENNINRQTLQKISTETADEVIGKIQRAD
jgi:hypothetical protein